VKLGEREDQADAWLRHSDQRWKARPPTSQHHTLEHDPGHEGCGNSARRHCPVSNLRDNCRRGTCGVGATLDDSRFRARDRLRQ
jgi:hypothetical protein